MQLATPPLDTASCLLLTQDARLTSQVSASLTPVIGKVTVFTEELELLRSLRHAACDLLVFDAHCVSPDDSSLLSWQRCHCSSPIPLIVLGHFNSSQCLLDWYRVGALDVLSVPFNAHELQARAKLATDAYEQISNDSGEILVGPYRLIQEKCLVYFGEEVIALTAREFSIAWILFSNPGVCFRRCQLARAVWGSHTEFTDRTMEQHIYKLRKKLHLSNQGGAVSIRTVYSHGYKLELSKHDYTGIPTAMNRTSTASLCHSLAI